MSEAKMVFIDGPPRQSGFYTSEYTGLWTSDLGEHARAMGRKWADDQAAIDQLTFGPREDIASAMLDGFIRNLRAAMAAEMTRSATARRDELIAKASARVEAEEARGDDTDEQHEEKTHG